MDNSWSREQSAVLYFKRYGLVATSTGCPHARIFLEHGWYTQGIPDAITPPRARANFNHKGRGDSRKRLGHQHFSTLLENKSLPCRQSLIGRFHVRQSQPQGVRYFLSGWRAIHCEKELVHLKAHLFIQIFARLHRVYPPILLTTYRIAPVAASWHSDRSARFVDQA